MKKSNVHTNKWNNAHTYKAPTRRKHFCCGLKLGCDISFHMIVFPECIPFDVSGTFICLSIHINNGAISVYNVWSNWNASFIGWNPFQYRPMVAWQINRVQSKPIVARLNHPSSYRPCRRGNKMHTLELKHLKFENGEFPFAICVAKHKIVVTFYNRSSVRKLGFQSTENWDISFASVKACSTNSPQTFLNDCFCVTVL